MRIQDIEGVAYKAQGVTFRRVAGGWHLNPPQPLLGGILTTLLPDSLLQTVSLLEQVEQVLCEHQPPQEPWGYRSEFLANGDTKALIALLGQALLMGPDQDDFATRAVLHSDEGLT
jgi:hypothetical protein